MQIKGCEHEPTIGIAKLAKLVLLFIIMQIMACIMLSHISFEKPLFEPFLFGACIGALMKE